MSIPAKIKMIDCIGKYATVDRDVQNGAGQGISKGTRIRIVGKGRGFNIETERCPHCGQYCYIRGITKDTLTLEKEREEQE